jgi:hypothetical protein
MMHRFAICLAIASLLFVAPRPAAAATTHTFDTVDAVELTAHLAGGNPRVIVTGILVGQTTPTTITFSFFTSSQHLAVQCQDLAVLAMSRPGKYQFAIGSDGSSSNPGGCKLILRAP